SGAGWGRVSGVGLGGGGSWAAQGNVPQSNRPTVTIGRHGIRIRVFLAQTLRRPQRGEFPRKGEPKRGAGQVRGGDFSAPRRPGLPLTGPGRTPVLFSHVGGGRQDPVYRGTAAFAGKAADRSARLRGGRVRRDMYRVRGRV